jgi:hypothetical protein
MIACYAERRVVGFGDHLCGCCWNMASELLCCILANVSRFCGVVTEDSEANVMFAATCKRVVIISRVCECC